MNLRKRRALMAVLVGGAVAACDDNSSRLCPAAIVVREAALIITGVSDSVSGAAITQFSVSGISWGGVSMTPEQAVDGILEPHASVMDSVLLCEMYCGFANHEGEWTFTVSASGYKPRTMSADAEWTDVERDGCFEFGVDGTEIKVILEPE
jgi:hypothetical protein